jgi:hypothetical protein
MEIKRTICPCCGATIMANTGAARARCEYCRQIIDFAEPETDSKNYGNAEDIMDRQITELANRIISLKKPLDKKNGAEGRCRYLKREIERHESNKSSEVSIAGEIFFATFINLIICSMFLLSGISYTGSWFVIFPILGFIGLEIIAVHLLAPLKVKKEVEYNKNMARLLNEKRETEALIDEIEGKYNFDFLPKQYQNSKDIDGLYRIVTVRRVNKLSMAISLYEVEIENKKIIDRQNKMIREQQEMIKEQQKQLRRSEHQANEARRRAQEEAEYRAKRERDRDIADTIEDIASIGATIYVGSKIWNHIKKMF